MDTLILRLPTRSPVWDEPESGEAMTTLREKDGIRYTALLVASVFTDGAEPVTRALGVGFRDFDRCVRLLLPKFDREGLSVVARDSATGLVVGAQMNDDMGTEIPDLSAACEGLSPALALLDELDRRYFGGHAVAPNHCAHFFFTAVSARYRGHQIASQLLELSLAIALNKGYRKAVAEATGLVSQTILRRAGFESCVEIPYLEFVHEGRRPFQGIKDHPSALLMHRVLNR
jgi:GNAT superfamily N-acetyltransferase